MATFAVGLLLLVAMAAHSDANYCVCNSQSETALQTNIDYACANGADCTAILQNGACYNPNTVRDHCNYAVNSYYQRRSSSGATCDFHGTATLSTNPPNSGSGCVYQSSPSTGGSTTPTAPGTGGTPNTSGGTTTPGTTPSTNTGTLTPGFGGGSLGPTGSGLGNTDNAASVALSSLGSTFMLVSFSIAILASGLM